MIFDSLSAPVPPVRHDLDLIPLENNGQNILYFHDAMQYMDSDFALDQKVEPILSLLTGRHSVKNICNLLNNSISAEELIGFVKFLDTNLALESNHYKSRAEEIESDFESADIRKPALAGLSYSEDPVRLKSFVSELLAQTKSTDHIPQKALFAPHIDLRVGKQSYADAFVSLKNLQPKRVVILATAHYSGMYHKQYEGKPFIGTLKNYSLPGSILKTDTDYVEKLNANADETGFTLKDRAHRIEHSIESHLVFIDQLWEHSFSIVPLLVGSLDELHYKPDGETGKKLNRFAEVLKQLDDDDTFYLISGDLSHVGKKFGDSDPAEKMRTEVEQSDRQFLDIALAGDPVKLQQHISKDYDPYRVCGFPPLSTFLNAFPGIRGTELTYEWWDESERESAVSFASIGF